MRNNAALRTRIGTDPEGNGSNSNSKPVAATATASASKRPRMLPLLSMFPARLSGKQLRKARRKQQLLDQATKAAGPPA